MTESPPARPPRRWWNKTLVVVAIAVGVQGLVLLALLLVWTSFLNGWSSNK